MTSSLIRPLSATLAASLAVAVGGGLSVAAAPAYAASPVVGHVYQATNDATGNALAVFARHSDGTLTPGATVATGGLGTGASLGSQGGVTRDGRLLFVVNGGSDSVSVLRATRGGLKLRDVVSSQGDVPVSVTVHDGVGDVLNQAGDTISGFTYDGHGHARVLNGSLRSLTPNPAGGTTGAAEVQFSPSGRTLVVTEKASNAVETFRVRHGYAGQATSHPSAGTTPYGFDFDRRGALVVSEAATGSASSYRLAPFHPVTSALGDTQAAACWLVISGHYAWVVNAASASVSSYQVHADGSLTLLQAVAASTGAGPTDAAVSPGGHDLFVRLGDGSVSSYRIGAGGTLTATDNEVVTTQHGVAGLVAD